MERIALLSVHTSPLATIGGKKVGGMNTYVREIAQEFARQGIIVDIFTRRIGPHEPLTDKSLGENVTVINVTAGDATPLSTDDIYAHVQQFTSGVIAYSIRHNIRYDLIFSHYWLSGLVAQSLKETWGTPFVQMFHTLGHMKNRIPSVNMPVPTIRIQAETKIVEQADRIIANTVAERSQLLWLYRADRRKIIVCPPGVNTERFQQISRQAAREHLKIPLNMKLLLFAGRIEPLKAADSILEALALLKEQNSQALANTHFAIIGGDPKDKSDVDMCNLQQLVTKLGLDDITVFMGAKNQSELAYYYAAANVVIMPSEYESFGMVALEAMATGTPVIASEVGGLAYLVQHGETGFLVPSRSPDELAERINLILQNPSLSETMGEKAADLAQNYAWSAIANQLIKGFALIFEPRKTAANI